MYCFTHFMQLDNQQTSIKKKRKNKEKEKKRAKEKENTYLHFNYFLENSYTLGYI